MATEQSECRDDVVEITTPLKVKSDVWMHFGHPVYTREGRKITDRDKVICRLCRSSSRYNGNTTNMKTHLLRHHASVYKPQISEKTSVVKVEQQGTSSIDENTVAPLKKPGQINIKDAFGYKYPFNSPRAKTLTRQIGVFIAADMRPLSLVENSEFKKLCLLLDPRYNVPSRRHFSDKVIPGLYEEVKENTVAKLQLANSVALTTDSWTSRACQSYVTITAHFTDQLWAIQSCVLQIRTLDVSHTGVNIGNALKVALIEWKLDHHHDIALVTDNASNMQIAAETAGLSPHIGCFAHTMNLASQKGLKVNSMARLLGRIRKIVNFFHRSTTATAVLKAKQELLKIEQHKLVIDVSTRWNSSYDMIERFLEQQPAIISALSSPEVKRNVKDIVTLTEEDINQAEQAMDVLKPLKTVTTIMCDKKCPTISMIIPMKYRIIDNLCENPVDSKLTKEVKQVIRDDLNKRYSDSDVRDFLLLAAALDPRFKSLPMLSSEERESVFSNVELRAISQRDTVQVKSEPEVVQNPDCNSEPALPSLPVDSDKVNNDKSNTEGLNDGPTPPKKSAIEDLLGDVYVVSCTPGNQKSVSDIVASEVADYKQEDNIPLSSCPLKWWKTNAGKYKHLSNLAKCILGIPGTSVPSERVFSTAGDIVTSTRSCLDPETVDQLVFLKKNM